MLPDVFNVIDEPRVLTRLMCTTQFVTNSSWDSRAVVFFVHLPRASDMSARLVWTVDTSRPDRWTSILNTTPGKEPYFRPPPPPRARLTCRWRSVAQRVYAPGNVALSPRNVFDRGHPVRPQSRSETVYIVAKYCRHTRWGLIHSDQFIQTAPSCAMWSLVMPRCSAIEWKRGWVLLPDILKYVESLTINSVGRKACNIHMFSRWVNLVPVWYHSYQIYLFIYVTKIIDGMTH